MVPQPGDRGARYATTSTNAGQPVLKILNGTEIVRSDLTAMIAGSSANSGGSFSPSAFPANINTYPHRQEPFREIVVHYPGVQVRGILPELLGGGGPGNGGGRARQLALFAQQRERSQRRQPEPERLHPGQRPARRANLHAHDDQPAYPQEATAFPYPALAINPPLKNEVPLSVSNDLP